MLDTSQSAATTIARWRAAGESGDADAAVACLSPDIVLSSPLTEQFRLEGSDQLRDFLASAFTAVEVIHFHTETGQGDTYALVYRARVGTQPFEEAQLLRPDDKAHIREITISCRKPSGPGFRQLVLDSSSRNRGADWDSLMEVLHPFRPLMGRNGRTGVTG